MGGGGGGGGLREGRLGGGPVGRFGVGGDPSRAIWGVGGGGRLPLPPLALPLTIPSP